MQIRNISAAISLASTIFSTTLSPIAIAATDVPALDEPPKVAAPAQRWLSHQDWHCITKESNDPKKYILGIRDRMNKLGQLGWEVVNFTQVSIANKSCYVVTFKTPYELTK